MSNVSTTDRLSSVDRGIGALVTAGAWLGAFATIALMLHIIADVFLRYFFNSPLPATIEIVSYWWMILVVFPGLAFTQRRNEHVDVTLLTSLMPDLQQAGLRIAARLVTIITVGALGWYGWLAALEQWHRGEIAMGSITILIWPMRFMVPLGMGLFAIQLLLDLYKDVVELRKVMSK